MFHFITWRFEILCYSHIIVFSSFANLSTGHFVILIFRTYLISIELRLAQVVLQKLIKNDQTTEILKVERKKYF